MTIILAKMEDTRPVVKITVGHWSISVHFLRMTAHNSTRAVGVGANDQSKSVVDRTIIKPYFDHCKTGIC